MTMSKGSQENIERIRTAKRGKERGPRGHMDESRDATKKKEMRANEESS